MLQQRAIKDDLAGVVRQKEHAVGCGDGTCQPSKGVLVQWLSQRVMDNRLNVRGLIRLGAEVDGVAGDGELDGRLQGIARASDGLLDLGEQGEGLVRVRDLLAEVGIRVLYDLNNDTVNIPGDDRGRSVPVQLPGQAQRLAQHPVYCGVVQTQRPGRVQGLPNEAGDTIKVGFHGADS